VAEERDKVTLSIGGEIYDGWTGVEIRRGLDTPVGSFTLSLAERAPGADRPFAFKAGAACEVRIGGETVITGWIDALNPSFSSDGHAISVSGRDKAADLVDCSAVHKPGSWRNTKLETIAAELAKPFGIKITAKASTAPPIKRFALQQGETVLEAIERLCRYRGLLAVSTVAGDIELVSPKAGEATERLAQGETILTAEGTHDVSERFSDYIIKGQSSGDDEASGKTVSQPKAESRDPAVKRHRPIIIIGEEQSDAGSLKKRASWEATVRAGRSQSATITVPGWRTPAGTLRDRGVTVEVAAPWLFMEGAMLVTEVGLMLDQDGTRTEFTVAPPEAFSQLAISEDADASAIGGKA
jgi:prophage tail gpP-like protein